VSGGTGGRPHQLTCLPVDGIGEVENGDDLAEVLSSAADLHDGDIVVVTSKVVSKAEGRVLAGSREEALAGETDRTVAVRGRTAIVRTHLGLVMAAAGIDASNTRPDTVVLLPRDPDASARRLREDLGRRTGRNVAVLITDTAGRAWRTGQTDLAVGAAGLDPLHDYAGRTDPHGNELSVTAPAVADELAGAADLVKRKLDRRPAALVRGLSDLVLAPGTHGPGAAALVRPEAQDMFGFGAREAVMAALVGEGHRGFGGTGSPAELVSALSALAGPRAAVSTAEDGSVTARVLGSERQQGATEAVLRAAAFAHGWRAEPPPVDQALLRFRPVTP
jgi:coenzyme F420-0:L-glutamate ligase / coenzyme F420-1:gamma-L-glutamate ligase